MSDYSLFKKPGGKVWYYRFQVDGAPTYRSTRETSRKAAVEVADAAYKAAKLRARGLEPEPTLGALAALWIQTHEHVFSPARLKTMRTFAAVHIESLHDLHLRDLTTERVEMARGAYLKDHARESANLWLSCLHTLVAWAIKRQMIRFIPWQVSKLKIQRKPKPLLPTLKAAPWLAAVDRLTVKEPGIAMAVRLMIGLGLRVSEALGARWEWLDRERRTYTPGDTKGGEAWARRVSPWLLAQLSAKAQVGGLIIPATPGRDPITDRRVAYAISKANKECEVLGITPHRLRGTYATWLSEMGVPIQDIQRALGHKDSHTTMRYLETNLDRVGDAQIRIGERMGLDLCISRAEGDTALTQSSLGEFYGRIHTGERP